MAHNSTRGIRHPAKVYEDGQIAEVFKNSAFFRGITKSQIDYLISLSSLSHYKKGQHVIRQGDIIHNFNIVLKGKIKAYLLSESGKVVSVDMFQDGDPFALGPVFDDRPSETYIQALEDTLVAHINKEKFRDFVLKNPDMALNFFKVLSHRLITATIRARDWVAYKVNRRLLETVQTLFYRYGRSIYFKGNELAEIAGTTTESVCRFMRRLKTEGIIATGRGKFTVLDENKLKNFTVD